MRSQGRGCGVTWLVPGKQAIIENTYFPSFCAQACSEKQPSLNQEENPSESAPDFLSGILKLQNCVF